MTKQPLTAAVRACVLALGIAFAASPACAVITINQPWLRPAQIAKSTELYMDITSSEGALLLGAHTDAADTVTILTPGRRIVPAAKLILAPGTKMALAPRAYRMALTGLHRPLRVGDRVLLVLVVEMGNDSRREIAVNAEVRIHSPIEDELHAHAHGHAPR